MFAVHYFLIQTFHEILQFAQITGFELFFLSLNVVNRLSRNFAHLVYENMLNKIGIDYMYSVKIKVLVHESP